MERQGGFAPLGAYSMLGDCRGGALVAADGAIDWLAVPRLDAAPVCAALLDPEGGGAITLAPTVPHECSQRYVPGTMVLETTFRCADGVVRVTDSLNRSVTGVLPWTELARRIEASGGPVPMRWEVRPGHRLGNARPWAEHCGDDLVLHVGDILLGLVADGVGSPRLEHGDGGALVTGEFSIGGGDRALLALTAAAGEPLPFASAREIDGRLDTTAEAWQQWTARIDHDGPHPGAVRRSALALKALTVAPSDGMAAALTTSLPERIGGERNFDYRFGWVRDASFAIDAQSRLGLSEEVHGSLAWLLEAVRATAPQVRTMYTLDGAPASAEMTGLEELPGYRGSLPVYVGNAAAEQLQLGAYGDLVDAVWRHNDQGGCLDPASSTAVADVVDRVCDRWQSKDAGLWELGDDEHYTSSKIGCWVALDRAMRLAEAGQVASGHADRWRTEREAVHAWVDEHCWSETKQSYTFYAGTDKLDAAVLLAARTGFLAGDDPRLASTVAAIRAELGAGGPLLYRYSGMSEHEGAFVACSCWLAEALVALGQHEEAAQLLDELVKYRTETGLLTEQVDPGTGELLGNLPQGLSHLAFIGAATALARRR
ncbi:MAG TPA: glycoside hydrolase family 15 protein [Marmoricola sp.]